MLTLQLSDAELAGRIYADLERTGQPIGLADAMIAAIAIQQNLTLVSGNLTHYQRIQYIMSDWKSIASEAKQSQNPCDCFAPLRCARNDLS